MEKKIFTQMRKHLGKTQKELAELLGVSVKSVSSYEQGWRNIPPHVERQLYSSTPEEERVLTGKIAGKSSHARLIVKATARRMSFSQALSAGLSMALSVSVLLRKTGRKRSPSARSAGFGSAFSGMLK